MHLDFYAVDIDHCFCAQGRIAIEEVAQQVQGLGPDTDVSVPDAPANDIQAIPCGVMCSHVESGTYEQAGVLAFCEIALTSREIPNQTRDSPKSFRLRV